MSERRDPAPILTYAAVMIAGLAAIFWPRFAIQETSGIPLEDDPLLALNLVDPIDLSSFSELGSREIQILVLLLIARTVWFAIRRRPLAPLLDLPILGFLIAVSGGSLSPLDPALAFVYLMGAIFLQTEAPATRRRVWLTARLILGLVAIHWTVLHHDQERLLEGGEVADARLQTRVESIDEKCGQPLASLAELLEATPGPAPDESAITAPEVTTMHELYGEVRRPIDENQASLSEFLAALLHETGSCTEASCPYCAGTASLLNPQFPPLRERSAKLDDDVDDARVRHFDARDKWQTSEWPGLLELDPVDNIDMIRESQTAIHSELEGEVELLQSVMVARDRLGEKRRAFQRESTVARVAVTLAIALFAVVALILRDRLRDRVRRTQLERDRREIEIQEKEKENWIALTAGLTHGLGNDILAYDTYLEEILEQLARGGEGDADRVRELAGFLHDSNKGRLAFLQFLKTFAEHHKTAGEHASDGSSSTPGHQVDLEQLFRDVRTRVAAVETADLPPFGSDPSVDRQLKKFRDLELDVRVESPESKIARGVHRGALEFFAYELVKNALRSATGARPLELILSRMDGSTRVRLINDVEVETSTGTCPQCSAEAAEIWSVRRRRDHAGVCEQCFGPVLQGILDASFEPGKGGGTGLGLFLIRYFLSTYHGGELRAAVHDAGARQVRFDLILPDTSGTPPEGTRR